MSIVLSFFILLIAPEVLALGPAVALYSLLLHTVDIFMSSTDLVCLPVASITIVSVVLMFNPGTESHVFDVLVHS